MHGAVLPFFSLHCCPGQKELKTRRSVTTRPVAVLKHMFVTEKHGFLLSVIYGTSISTATRHGTVHVRKRAARPAGCEPPHAMLDSPPTNTAPDPH
jgi:hypothetical protein